MLAKRSWRDSFHFGQAKGSSNAVTILLKFRFLSDCCNRPLYIYVTRENKDYARAKHEYASAGQKGAEKWNRLVELKSISATGRHIDHPIDISRELN